MKNQELFILIQSLTKSEKRYFKLFCAKGQGDKNYLKLFDAIASQQVYDEKEIKRFFKNDAFVKQLHVAKTYLRDAILDSLRSFHKNLSKDAVLKKMLRNVEILFHKELYSLCRTELQKAERLAMKYELLTGQVEVISWKRKIEQNSQPNNFPVFYDLAKEQENVISNIEESNLYWQHVVVDTWKMLRNDNNIPELIQPIPPKAVTLEAQVLQYTIRYINYLRTNKQDKAIKELYQLIEVLESSSYRILEDPSAYVSTINNLASYLLFQKKEEEVLILLDKAKTTYAKLKITTENKSLLKQILRTYNLELELYRDKKRRKGDVVDYIKSTEKFVEDNRNKIPKDYLLSLCYQLAHIHFVDGNMDVALKWINVILNTKFGDTRQDLQVHGRMLNLMIHFEQQNFFVLRYFVDSTKRFMKKVKTIQPFEQVLLRFFTKIATAPMYEYKDMFKKLQDTLFNNEDTLIPDGIMDYINYKEWIEGKV